ncbi:hypothetical protein D3C74_47190 [compost metagenome]
MVKTTHTAQVRAHLYERGFAETDILQIKTKISQVPLISSTVVFSDEPDAIYSYVIRNDRLIQLSHAKFDRGIRREVPDSEFKHVEEQ